MSDHQSSELLVCKVDELEKFNTRGHHLEYISNRWEVFWIVPRPYWDIPCLRECGLLNTAWLSSSIMFFIIDRPPAGRMEIDSRIVWVIAVSGSTSKKFGRFCTVIVPESLRIWLWHNVFKRCRVECRTKWFCKGLDGQVLGLMRGYQGVHSLRLLVKEI